MSRKRSRSSSSSASSSSSGSRSRSSSSGSSASRSTSKKSGRSRSSSSSSSSVRKSRSRSKSVTSRSSRDSKSLSRERKRSRSRSRSRGFKRSISPKNRAKSPFNAKSTKIYIGRLSRNVLKDHVVEIFCNYGTIKSVELPVDRVHPYLSRGFAYVEYEKPENAEKAIKYMDGGQIDGLVINVSIAVGPKPRYNGPPMRRGGPSGWRPKNSPPRRRRSPARYRGRGSRRSRSNSFSRSCSSSRGSAPRRRRSSS